MKRIVYITIALLINSYISAQQFSTKLYLENVNHEKDTLEVGYDQKGTFGVDEEFGEIEQKDVIPSNKFQAFIVNIKRPTEYDNINEYNKKDIFFKKQIVGINKGWRVNGAFGVIVPFDILPITVSWDKSLFQNSERDYSVITDFHPGCWFDCTDESTSFLEQMKEISSVTIPERTIRPRVYYDDGTTKHPMYIFYIINIEKKPNDNIEFIEVFTLDGRSMKKINKPTTKIDCKDWKEGLYILKVKTDKGTGNYKIHIKNNKL